ncbi:hypothetical protein LUZ60_000419 [Juncus effusus]|nr:hypothetical protein LUZ60_000419 [Juncus effusus]
MLNTEVGAVLAAIRRTIDPSLASSAILLDDQLVQSLKALRTIIFHTDWHTTNPSVYLSPFLEVIQSDDVPSAATGAALSAILKVLQFEVFDERSPGAFEAVLSIVSAITNCKLERTDPNEEDAVMMRVLQVLLSLVRCPAGRLLNDQAVCMIVQTCFLVVQQSVYRGDLLQRAARHCMHELIQTIYRHLPEIKASDPDGADLSVLEHDLGYGAQCLTSIFEFLCSLLNVGETADGYGSAGSEENVQLFALVLINTAVELGGESIGSHPELLCLIEDNLFYNLVHHAMRSSPLVLSMICSTVLNLYNFLRRSLRFQLETFFVHVLLRIGAGMSGLHLQEVAIENIISFCRQPTFLIEMFVNYDCDPIRHNVLEEIGRLLCKTAFPQVNGNQMTPLQIQAFNGLVHIITTIADSMESSSSNDKPRSNDMYNLKIVEYDSAIDGSPPEPDSDTWVDFVRKRKLKKKKIMIAAHHYNRDEKKGLEYLNLSHVVQTPPEPKALAYFFRYTPGLDKTKIGEYLAIRTFLESFWLPGESQKIHRILEVFSEKFYEQQTSGIFADKDAVFVLCYSLIMLNTDQHNPQVKKKMTLEEFISNNRGANNGENFPREYLTELFRSIATNEIQIMTQNNVAIELNRHKWNELIRRSYVTGSFILCDFKHELSREIFAIMSGQSVATLAAIFECTNDEDVRSECVEGMISVARIAQYGLEDVLDELLSCLCKFTGLLNPYNCAEDTQSEFNQSVKMRMATLALFTIANRFGDSIRGAWKNVVDCMIKLKRIKLLPQLGIDSSSGTVTLVSNESSQTIHNKSESGVIFPSSHQGMGTSQYVSGMIGRFSQILSLETGAESMLNMSSESEMNMKLMEQCRIANIFTESMNLSDETLHFLGRALIFAAYGKGQKFSTLNEENETVGFCWDLISTITFNNLHRFLAFWPQFHEAFTAIQQFPSLSPSPFPERAIVAIFKIAAKMLSSDAPHTDKSPEEIIFKSINLMCKMDKEILDICCESLVEPVVILITEQAQNIQSLLGWKTLLHILQILGRHPETFDRSVEAFINLMTGEYLTRYNYSFCIETAINFVVQKIIPLEKSATILGLLGGSINRIVEWQKSGLSDPNNTEDVARVSMNLYLKLVDGLRKTCLIRREEIRRQALLEMIKCFQTAADELELRPSTCLACFNHAVLPMVDDVHEKTLDYSRRDPRGREAESMSFTFLAVMDLLADFYVMFLMQLWQDPDFRTYWLGVLRRMDMWMKTDYGDVGTIEIRNKIPDVLKKMIRGMKEKGILVPADGDMLWESTYIQAQWIAPSVIEELFLR